MGEKRALEVRRFLINLGVSPDRLSTVSFGEERPLALGHDEASWAINRRVDLVIVNKP
ncbi:OmpA family protein [Thermosulfurimonas sp.]|uniref:OmpA family protein n=1 Tax=Thermosulfurimonas sp. TaxID=2080236 RepID=UPI003425B996